MSGPVGKNAVAAGPPFGRSGSSHLVHPRLSPIIDPAEPWEIPVLKKDRRMVEQILPGRPFRPTRLADVPAPAMSALESACGPLPLERLYVVPRTTRLVTSSSSVITPAKVIGFGDRTVGVWVDDGPEGRLLSIPTEQILAVDDRTILLYGRLRLVAAEFAAGRPLQHRRAVRDRAEPGSPARPGGDRSGVFGADRTWLPLARPKPQYGRG